MTTIDTLADLLMGHLKGTLSDAEQSQLTIWLSQSDRNRLLFDSIDNEEQLRQLVLMYHEEEASDNETIILAKIRQGIAADVVEAPVRRIGWLPAWGWVAASVLLLAGIGGYFWLNNKEAEQAPVVAAKPADIPPGKDGAILTLADGSQVVLDSLGNGIIATQQGTQVVLKNGELAYNTATGVTAPVYNTLSTPKGRQFQLSLPDGSKVWLNTASSLRYPTVFAGDTRQVEVTGEVYFEVAKNAAKPFIIHVNNRATLQVLGTQFNVNAYSNETAIKTTLVEGSLQVVSGTTLTGDKAAVLKPGQQAQISNNATTASELQPVKVLSNADVDKAVAWKSGVFNFEDASLEEVMRQIERWYDIEVVYEKGIPNIRFGGKLSRDVSLHGLLQSLQESEVHYRLEGRKLIVLP